MSNFTKLKLCHTFGISRNTHIWVKGALTALLLVLCGNVAKAQSDLTFNEGIRYSKWVIDSRMNEFYANKTKCGFAVYNQSGNKTAERVDGKTSLDYVVGLVAKSIIEASQYYSQFTWAQSFAKPWFLSIQNYGNKFYSGVATSGGSLDDLNAVKLYLPLRELTKPGGTFEDNTTYLNTATALNKAITGLQAHNKTYSITDENILAKKAGHDVLGGWWHKSIYENQMWLDGAYMGSALFAELVNYSGNTTNIDATNDWNIIVKQFTILRSMCWNETDKLPYHAFAADGGTNTKSHSDTWAGLSSTSPYVFHSASYWGRAVGWYFLALVDILEQMDKANLTATDGYKTLKGYLAETAEGLKARQDQETGGWYQILDKDGTYSASEYNNGLSHTTTYNYIESSATALFTAAYLKAIRKKYLDETTYKTVAENGYKCLINQFFSVDDNGNVNIFGSCRSAGLGGNEDLNAAGKRKFRDGSKPYYLLGSDVAMVKKSENVTEGKVLGAFILAATEYERQYQNYPLLSEDLRSSYSLSNGKSISVEVTGNSSYTVAYQWYKYDATTSTSTVIDNATEASFKPTASGKYYCEITLTQESSSAITRAANKITYQTRTTDVEVTGTAANLYTVTFNAGSNGTCSTPSLTQSSANASINLPSVTPNTGYTFDGWYDADGNEIGGAGATYAPKSDITLYAHYTATGGSGTVIYKYTVNSKENTAGKVYTATGGTATLGAEKVEANGFKSDGGIGSSKYIKVDLTGNKLQKGDVITIKAYSTSNGGGIYIATATTANSSYVNAGNLSAKNTAEELKYTVTETDVLNGLSTIYLFRNGTTSNSGTSTYIQEITITRSGSSTDTPSNNASATFTYDGSELSFTDNVATINLKISQANSSITVNATPATGATITTSSANTSVADNVITITTPAAGSSANYAYTVKSQDGTKTQTYTINVNVAAEVVGKEYSLKVTSSSKTPKCNESWYITGDTDNDKLVKMTFGGWKYNSNKYLKPNADDIDANYITDEWSAPATQAKVNTLDGYEYAISGKYDAVHEDKTKTTEMYGKTRYGWFVSPERVNGITTKSFPFTLPVRGAYMTFEPTKNGTLTIYLLQNGAWNSDNNNDIIPGQFRMHAFQITNQRGLVLEEFAPQYEITVNQQVKDGYSCSQYTNDPGTGNYNPSSKDISDWEEFWTLNDEERKAVHDNWANGKDGSQTIIKLKNGSFLAIQKAIVKYQFHVTGNETYYMFSNFSKLGFSGATFQPDDAQPTDEKTFSGNNSLSDTKAFTEIEKTANGKIPGTEMVNYRYTINGTEVGKVDGVYIPQFKAITLNRTFKKDQWTTLTLPFNLTEDEVQTIFGDGTRLVMLHDATLHNGGAHLTFIYHEIQNVLPGYPYLIKPKRDVNSFTANNKCINPHIDQFEVKTTPYTFKGTPSYSANATNDGKTGYSVNYAENDIFVSETNGNLYVSGGSSYGKGYRAWLQKNEGTAGVKSISVVMSSFSDDDDTTTSIDVAEMAPDLIEALGIQTGVYNLSGQRVANDTRNLKAGIYIVNGKKTVVR